MSENDELGEAVPIGELAHNVGWGAKSPRGDDDELPTDQRQLDGNFILTCRNCHKPIDDGGVVGRYSKHELARRKQEHEARIRDLTAIGSDRTAYVLRVVGDIRGVAPALSRDTVLTAATTAGLYPRILPGGHWDSDADLDLRGHGLLSSRLDFERLLPVLDTFVARVHDGVRREAVDRLAVFGFARIPLLVALGARLDDKVPIQVFQRQRVDDVNAWNWADDRTEPLKLNVAHTRAGSNSQAVALVLNLSGTIGDAEVLEAVSPDHHVYTIGPMPPANPSPSLIRSPADLALFEATARGFLTRMESDHRGLTHIDLFPAIGLSAAITIGRTLMADVSPTLNIYDRGPDRRFFLALSASAARPGHTA